MTISGPMASGKSRAITAIVQYEGSQALDLSGQHIRDIKRLVAHDMGRPHPSEVVLVDECNAETLQFLRRSEHPGRAVVTLTTER